ncbi:hypothetical protein A1Q1_02644 [Trichosporon asahii var. asahii CBS 2479]|uniref:TMEM205-like domain-containing protein n=1 Tax=Trichosporon asahii var. asahii (strain ATCC 90039 / CBS 2479 / JCM 2466 / KCTC 7840 / NBRC 103889/ NCYC 2677 / UAMH 7654) TaxID=1186058 RepID=J5SZH5_TRIAS|nr:hypothetical protein A1Q1_02644 [Trichosporon asahii var. asahii CBS 2479]EJT48361.1 hypothetical protein A1Q1_02644 [Trichosporon asahii var. asahii CBS 2479]
MGSLAPFTLKGFYLLTWGNALGSNVWNTISGFKAYSSVPKETFSLLSSVQQPLYLQTQVTLTTLLLGTHLNFHRSLLHTHKWWQHEEGVQALLVLGAWAPTLINALIVGPACARAAIDRAGLEKVEGKDASSPAASTELQNANTRFQLYHGISSALNAVSLIALTTLGLAISA